MIALDTPKTTDNRIWYALTDGVSIRSASVRKMYHDEMKRQPETVESCGWWWMRLDEKTYGDLIPKS